MFPASYFSALPRPDLQVLSPDMPPYPGQELIGYTIYEAPESCLVAPRCERLNFAGWMTSTLLLLVCWPLTCVPCCCGCFYDGFQVPVYK